jgi:hypothetical protein
MLVQYPIVFQKVLERMSAGCLLKNILAEDLREFEVTHFRNWIRRDKERESLLHAAEEARTEVWAEQLIEISAGKTGLEDVQRSKLEIDTLKWLMASHNRKRYGESTKIEMNATVEVKQSREDLLKNAMKFQETVRETTGTYVPKSKGEVIDV